MSIKRIVKPLLIPALVLLAYLGMATAWAMVSFEDVIAGAPAVADARLAAGSIPRWTDATHFSTNQV